MNREAAALWDRAQTALESARTLAASDPDGAASRAYYAAFYAVSAVFAEEDRLFTKHTAVAAAVHRDLVRAGRVSAEAGRSYTWLMRLRQTGDYGQEFRVTAEEAEEAVRRADSLVSEVAGMIG